MQGFILLLIFLFLLTKVSLAATEFFVGVSPPLIDLGEIERGQTKIVNFYLVTPSAEPLLVYLESERGSLDFFTDRYQELILNYSEEDAMTWIEFLANPIELRQANESLKTKGGEIRGWRKVNFLLHVPKNAEPGYHSVRVKPFPVLPTEIFGQAGARVVAITSVTLLFKVPGDASRNAIILDVTPGSYSGQRLEINTYLQNVGTVTISAKASQSIYKENKSIASLTSALEYVKPGEVKVLKTYLPLDGILPGDYDVITEVSFTTGKAYKNASITIVQPPVIERKVEVFPFWIIIVIIVIIALLVYWWYKRD